MYRLSISLLVTLFLYSCGTSELGDQPPENVTIMASDDGSVIIRQYKIYKITSYIQDGGKTERQGSVTNYLEAYSGTTGQLLSARAFPIKQNCQLLKVTDSHAWLSVYNKETSKSELLGIRIPVFSTSFDEKQLAEKNNGLVFKPNIIYYNPPGYTGVILQADDARIYAVNEDTKLASRIPDTIKTKTKRPGILTMNNLELQNCRFDFTGNQRKKLIANLNDSKEEVLSESDFINPHIVGTYNTQLMQELPLTIDECLLIISKTKDNNAFEFQLTLIDSVTLKDRWVAILENPKGESSENDLLDIQLHGNDLLVLTKSSMNLQNTETGTWKWNKNFD